MNLPASSSLVVHARPSHFSHAWLPRHPAAAPAAVAKATLLCACLALGTLLPAGASAANPELLHDVFQDHAVLQREQPIPLWGQALAGEQVQIEFAGKRVRSRADADGHWQASLPALPAGGPYTLIVSTGSVQQRITDVLVGDVWLCSGQSNMELPVHRALDSRAEIAAGEQPRIRMFKVAKAASPLPMQGFGGTPRWQLTTPETVREYSATCYYFARELQQHVDVPMGLIDASWGGSRIQAWTSAAALRASGQYDAELDVLARYASDPVTATADWGRIWQSWWQTRPGLAADDAPWQSLQRVETPWQPAPAALGAWEHWGVPELAEFDGLVWYRTQVTLTAQQAVQPARLLLGAIDEIDQTWVNGRSVGSSYGADTLRDYTLPAGLLHEGDNSLVVAVLDTYRSGGIIGPASSRALQLADGSRVPLEGTWLYRRVPAAYGTPPRAPWHSAAGLSTLYNGMIAPLGHYALRGALWYQGESNTFEAERYGQLLRNYRHDLRSQFGAELPLLLVQLANYGKAASQPGSSDWAQLREMQRQVSLEDPHSALAISIDIGDRYDIHPANKQELGRRLARAVRHQVYGEKLSVSGPVPMAARREGNAIALRFTDIDGALRAYGADAPVGFELCEAAADSCRYAHADIHHDTVLLQAANVATATRVRYAWADSPVVNLYDDSGLPAGPFEISIP